MAEKKTAAKTAKPAKASKAVVAQPRLKALYNSELKAKLAKENSPPATGWRFTM